MHRQDFDYQLPESLIAKQPTQERSASRLLQLSGSTGSVLDKHFGDILDLLQPGDLMVFNDTRVIPARVYGQKTTGGKLEILVERVLSESLILAHIRSSKSPKPGSRILLSGGEGQSVNHEQCVELEVISRRGALFELKFPEGQSALDVLNVIGHMPLPPYIDRPDEEADRERYQTVYGKNLGAVAAPTAGLHFDDVLIEKIEKKGVDIGFVTLHVGAGTFQPVRVDDIYQHKMHSEVMVLSEALCEKVKKTKAAGGRVVAVGTTSVRCLETAAQTGQILPYQGDTEIFIYPSYQFEIVDCLLTNFHLPESTLIMLVSAFAGYKHTMSAYLHAVQQKYRFFSYGDAMFIERNPNAHLDLPKGKS